MKTYFDFPYAADGRGRTAQTDSSDHLRDLIHQVLFSAPGERVNRPDFGCGIDQLTFMPNSDALAVATQFLVQGALTRWLDGVIAVHEVRVVNVDATMTVHVSFADLRTGDTQTMAFPVPDSSP